MCRVEPDKKGEKTVDWNEKLISIFERNCSIDFIFSIILIFQDSWTRIVFENPHMFNKILFTITTILNNKSTYLETWNKLKEHSVEEGTRWFYMYTQYSLYIFCCTLVIMFIVHILYLLINQVPVLWVSLPLYLQKNSFKAPIIEVYNVHSWSNSIYSNPEAVAH